MLPTVNLPGTPPPTTALGFGGNALLGAKSRREGLALLAAAFDSGIRHFDTARAYSSGDAEGLLGEFLATENRRDQVTITTKFGLRPPSGGVSRMRWVKGLARKVMRLSPGLKKAISARSGQMVQRGAFSVDDARASLATSLRELRTDRVNLLLLHEGSASDCTPELRSFLESARDEGKIGAFGVGSRFDRIAEVLRIRPEFAGVIQFESSAVHPNRRSLGDIASFTITHGAIGGSFGELRHLLQARPETLRQWSDTLGLDLADNATLAPLMLAQAVQANPGGIVLFSSTRPEAIRANIRAVIDGRFADDQVRKFGDLARGAFVRDA